MYFPDPKRKNCATGALQTIQQKYSTVIATSVNIHINIYTTTHTTINNT